MPIAVIDSFAHQVVPAADASGLYSFLTSPAPTIVADPWTDQNGSGYALQAAATGATRYLAVKVPGATNMTVGRVDFGFTVLPTVDTIILHSTATVIGWSVLQLSWDATSGKIKGLVGGAGSIPAVGPVIAAGQWYRLDWDADISTATWAGTFAVNETTSATGTRASSPTGGVTDNLNVGVGSAVTATALYRNLIVRADANLSAFPIGRKRSRIYVPSAVGTHSLDASPSSYFFKSVGSDVALDQPETAGAPGLSFNLLDELPLASGTDHVTVKPGTPVLPAHRATGAAVAGTSSATSITLPADSTGDLEILVVGTTTGNAVVFDSNGGSAWTSMFTPVDVTAGERLSAWYRIKQGGDTAPQIHVASGPFIAAVSSWSGVNPDAPVHLVTTGTEATSDTSFSFAPGTSTVEANEYVICIYTSKIVSASAQGGTMTNASLGTVTERADYSTANTGGGGFTISGGTRVTAGTLGTFAATMATATPKTYVSFALRPAQQPRLTQYLEEQIGDESSILDPPDVVRVVVACRNDVADPAGVVTARVSDGVSASDIFTALQFNFASLFYRLLVLPTPPSGGSWTIALLNAARVQFGFTASANGGMRLDGITVEAFFPPQIPISGTDANGTTTESGVQTTSGNAVSDSDVDGTTTDAPTLTAAIAATDANGTTTESPTLAAVPSPTDADGTISEAPTLVAVLTPTDANSATIESPAVAVPISGSDASAAGSDAPSLVAVLSPTDASAAGSDAPTLVTALSSADANSTTTEAPIPSKVATDANGATTDTPVLTTALSGTDANGSTTETPLVTKVVADADATITESPVLSAALSATDVDATISETPAVSQSYVVTDSDSAVTEAVGINVTVSDASQAGSDIPALAAAQTATDVNGAKTEATLLSILGPDANGATTETPTVTASYTVTDTNTTVIDSASNTLGGIVNDSTSSTTSTPTLTANEASADADGTVSEAPVVAYNATPSETGQGSESATVIISWLVTDVSSGSDSVSAQISYVVADSGIGTGQTQILGALLLSPDTAGPALDEFAIQSLLVDLASGLGTDLQSLSAAYANSDGGSSSDSGAASRALSGFDAGTFADILAGYGVNIQGLDSCQGVDTQTSASDTIPMPKIKTGLIAKDKPGVAFPTGNVLIGRISRQVQGRTKVPV